MIFNFLDKLIGVRHYFQFHIYWYGHCLKMSSCLRSDHLTKYIFFYIFIHTKGKLPQEVVMKITELWFPEFQLNSSTNLSSDKPFLFITFVLADLLLGGSLLRKNQVSYLSLHSPYQLLCYLPFHFCVLRCSNTCSLYTFLHEDHLWLFFFFLKRYLSPEVTGGCFAPVLHFALLHWFAHVFQTTWN